MISYICNFNLLVKSDHPISQQNHDANPIKGFTLSMSFGKYINIEDTLYRSTHTILAYPKPGSMFVANNLYTATKLDQQSQFLAHFADLN